jgi:hypothetical protein
VVCLGLEEKLLPKVAWNTQLGAIGERWTKQNSFPKFSDEIWIER